MDMNTVRGLSTILVAIAFFCICWWAFSPKRKKKFDEAAQLPFADEEISTRSANHREREKHRGNKV